MERQASRRWRSGSYKRRRRKKKFSEKLADWTRQFIAFLFSNVGIICVVIGYTIAGASIFVAIEKNYNYYDDEFYVNRTIERTIIKLWDFTAKVR